MRSENRVTGVRYRDSEGRFHDLAAKLTVAADGRWSAIRRRLGWSIRERPSGMDVWQIRIPKESLADWHAEVLGSYRNGLAAVAQDRHDYVQTAFLIAKGTDAEARAKGLGWLRESLQLLFGWPDAAVATITDWADVPFLEVRSGIADTWSADGVVCLGDAAHPMPPAGGVGVNLAVQDALALANLCARRWDDGLTQRVLRPFRCHRRAAALLVQRLQRGEEQGVIMPALEGRLPRHGLPWFLGIPSRVPWARHAAAILSTVMALPSRSSVVFRQSTKESMTESQVRVSRTIDASAEKLFEVMADPEQHAAMDGSGMLTSQEAGKRLTAQGQKFTMNMHWDRLGGDYQTDNYVNGFLLNRRLGWLTADAGEEPAGWAWLWEFEPNSAGGTTVTLTYDWSEVHDPDVLARVEFPVVSRAQLESSLDRLAETVS